MVATVTQATKGMPALEATESTGFAWRTNSTPVATMDAAATVLTPSCRCLKKSRLHPPIMNMFHESTASARFRVTVGGARHNRYAAAPRAPSIPIQVTGMIQSGGLNHGFRRDLYQILMNGWFGDGELEALNAKGTMKAPVANATAAGRDAGGIRWFKMGLLPTANVTD